MSMRLFDLVGCLSAAMDLVSPEVVGHHRRVGSIAASLARLAGLSERDRADAALAGLMHDVGAFSLGDRLSALAFDASDASHARTGHRLLAGFPAFAHAAALINLHHTPWSRRTDIPEEARPHADLANLLCLADRTDTLLPRSDRQTPDLEAVLARIRQGEDRMFKPEWVRVLEELSRDGEFWGRLLSPNLPDVSATIAPRDNPIISLDDLAELSGVFSQIIDFRCRFTATHSRGVAATAVELARCVGMARTDLVLLGVAGNLHDLGKLGVPSEIICKPGALTPEETTVMRRHARLSAEALGGVAALEQVAAWAGTHHERLNGLGYPQGLTAGDLGLGSRVMAVSDVFTALAEDRPYRQGMALDTAVDVLAGMVRAGGLDADVFDALNGNLVQVNRIRVMAQSQARREFERFSASPA